MTSSSCCTAAYNPMQDNVEKQQQQQQQQHQQQQQPTLPVVDSHVVNKEDPLLYHHHHHHDSQLIGASARVCCGCTMAMFWLCCVLPAVLMVAVYMYVSNKLKEQQNWGDSSNWTAAGSNYFSYSDDDASSWSDYFSNMDDAPISNYIAQYSNGGGGGDGEDEDESSWTSYFCKYWNCEEDDGEGR